MTERASIFQNALIGIESTPGTPVLATLKLPALKVALGMKFDVKKYKPSGYRFDTIVVPNKEWAEGKISGPISYKELPYLLNSLIKRVTASGGGAAKTRVYAPSTTSEDAHDTFTIEQGDPNFAHRVSYALVTGLTLNFSRNACELDGTLISKALETGIHLDTDAKYTLTAAAAPPTTGNFTLTVAGQTTANISHSASAAAVQAALEALSSVGTGNVIVTRTTGTTTLAQANAVYTVEFIAAMGQQAVTMTGTFTGLTPTSSIALASSQVGAAPTQVAESPVLPTHVSVYMSDTQAGLATADEMTRVLNCSWSLTDLYGALWTLNRSVTSFAAMVPTEPKASFKIKLEADTEGLTPLTNIRAGSTKFFRIEAIGELIEGSDYFKVQIDMAAKAESPSEFSDEDGVFALEWSFDVVHDASWGKAMDLTVVNTLAVP